MKKKKKDLEKIANDFANAIIYKMLINSLPDEKVVVYNKN